MQETILIVYLVVAIALVGIILLQQGKGAEMGASFGAGGANTVFGAAGSGNALTKATTILAILFFGIALSISYLNSSPVEVKDSIFDDAPVVEKTDLDSTLPIDPATTASKGIESELPPSDKADTLETTPVVKENQENVEKKTKEPASENESNSKDDSENQ